MPFGYNPLWRTWICPMCKGTFHFKLIDKFARESAEAFIQKHSKWHRENDPQKRLYTGPFVIENEVKSLVNIEPQAIEPKVKSKSGLPTIRPAQLGLTVGQNIEFTITGVLEEAGSEKDRWYTVPVEFKLRGKTEKGQYSLSRTNCRVLSATFGMDGDQWVGGKFTSFAQFVLNPKTQTQQIGLVVVDGSAKKS
jgi:hypothetical protein